MRKDKEIAINLRKQGKSYREIKESLKIPLSTLSGWFADVDWSKDMARKLSEAGSHKSTVRLVELNKIRGQLLVRAYEDARKEAAEELKELRYNPLFIAGLMLYWGEGGKNPRTGAKFSNTDPELIKLYVFFLTQACRIPMEKIKLHILVYPDLEEKTCRAYWSRTSGVPWENFTKSVLIKGRHKTRRLTWGVCNVTVSSVYFKQKILEWLNLLPKELMNKAYYESI